MSGVKILWRINPKHEYTCLRAEVVGPLKTPIWPDAILNPDHLQSRENTDDKFR